MLTIRQARNADRQAIVDVHRAAFRTDAEARLFEMLNDDGDVRLSLIAELDGRVVGSNILSAKTVSGDNRSVVAWAVGPIGVLPDELGKGIGCELMRRAIDEARVGGIQMLFLLGNP